MAGQVHYEIFARKTPQSGWALQNAVEDRDVALAQAEEILVSKRAAAIKVTKEIFSGETGEFRSYVLLTKGAPENKERRKIAAGADPVCASPQDLYTRHARETIARVLEEWLNRQGVTAFELLHRPDLCERLDNASNDLNHAIQKIAVPEAQETGASIHEIMRRWTRLAETAIARVIADGRRKTFPDLDLDGDIPAQITRLSGQAERAYVLGGALVKHTGGERRAARKLIPLTRLAKALSPHPELKWAMDVIEAPLVEMFARKGGLSDILSTEIDPGDGLAFLTHIVNAEAVERLSVADSSISRALPVPPAHLEDFARLIRQGHFRDLRLQAFRNVMTELRGVKRLKPANPVGEIDLLRAMALALTVGSQQQNEREDIADAFIERSRMLVSPAFVEDLTAGAEHCLEEIERILWLCENVVGPANKKQAARWLMSALTAHRFECDLRDAKRPAGARLQLLVQLQRRVQKATLAETDQIAAMNRLGLLGSQIAQDVQLIPHILRGSKTPLQRIITLLSFATGQAGPEGPLSEMAKAEVMKQLRSPEVRTSLMGDPVAVRQIRPLLVQAGLAA